MKEHYDFSKGRKNPHAATMKAQGYSVTEHYTPKDLTDSEFDDTKDIIAALVEIMSTDDCARLLRHIKDNYDLPCPAELWEGVQ